MSTIRDKTREKVLRKIEALEEYRDTKQARFPMPPKGKFSANWFSNLEVEAEGLEKVSKALPCLRVGGEYEERLKIALRDSQGVYDAIQEFDPKAMDDVAKLKAERDQLKKQLQRLAQDVLDLMIENEDYRDRLGVKQAQHRDHSKVRYLADSND